ncbi:MAG: DNRLRE domain-containing protein [Oscillospiraceae bacterium]|jgi:hypothetical protein|nr:DNRLRE domain-containing protein [Oscillospiraceae bacterium]
MTIQKRFEHRTRVAAFLLLALLLIALSAGCASEEVAPDTQGEPEASGDVGGEIVEKTVDVQGADITVTSWVSESRPDENVSNEKDVSYIDVGLGTDGNERIGLVRFDLPAGVTPQEFVSARLFLKKKDGDETGIRVGSVVAPWGFALASWNDIQGNITFHDGSPASEKEGEDWYTIDVTGLVREYFAGTNPNYGFAVAGTEEGKITSFWSVFGDDVVNYPRLSVRFRESVPAEKYGRYGYTEMSDDNGNCLSYALRDKDDIYLQDLITDADAEAFASAVEAGIDEAMAYFREKLAAYIDAHKEKLAIKSWRALSGFNDPIDPEKEYMIALKIGVQDTDEDVMSAFGNFDYHFRVRLDDGRWAEKIPHITSRVTPGSNAAFDSGKYPWDSVFQWGYPKWTNYYNSSAIYFAITKSVDEFTAHRH